MAIFQPQNLTVVEPTWADDCINPVYMTHWASALADQKIYNSASECPFKSKPRCFAWRICKLLVILLVACHCIVHNRAGHFTFWIILSLRPKTDQTAQLWSQSRVQINQSHVAHVTAHSIMSSLISLYFFAYLWISEKVKWFSFIET